MTGDRLEVPVEREMERRRIDPRVRFFVVVAAICFLLVPAAAQSYRFVPLLLGGIYTVLAALFLLDSLSRR